MVGGREAFARRNRQYDERDLAMIALFFDVFGTLVDWRTGVARETEFILKPRGYSLEWPAFADAWVAEYQPGIEAVRSGRISYTKLDVLLRQMLDTILPRFGVTGLPEEDRQLLTFAWHRLDGWSDVKPALVRLSRHFMLAPVSNGNFLIMADIAKRNGWRWDAILGADIARDYKPKPRVYLAAAEALDLRPGDCLMVSAHYDDLTSPAASGMRTAYVARPDEYGPGKEPEPIAGNVDISVNSLEELADKLDA
jgi:2-haloacid dehalogenase